MSTDEENSPMHQNQTAGCGSIDRRPTAPGHRPKVVPAAVNKISGMSSNPLNAVNRGVYIADNLPFLQSLNDECVDLVCIDPPFAKNETFGRKNAKDKDPLKPPLSKEERATELALLRRWGINSPADATAKGINWPETAYKDFWSWERDVHEEWLRDIEDDYPAIAKLIDVTRDIHGDDTAAYLCYMAVRLLEIKRVLKDAGSLYLHCDHTAGAYLRQLLDAIFGKKNFRNEISWGYKKWSNAASYWQRNHDTILFYTKETDYTFNKEYRVTPRKQVSIDRGYETNTVQGGKRQLMVYDPAKAQKEIAKGDHYDVIIDMSKRPQGAPVYDWWDDIPYLNSQATERTGYPTQKPVALAERIIKASCPEDGVVLDCFAGCAYVAIAAERLNRNWVACDINARAWTVFKRQFEKPSLAVLNCEEPRPGQQTALIANSVTVYGPDDLPVQTVASAERPAPTFRLRDKPRGFKVPASIIPEQEMLEILLELSGYTAWCCGFANRKSDGTIVKTRRNFHLDHLAPVSKDGTRPRHTEPCANVP